MGQEAPKNREEAMVIIDTFIEENLVVCCQELYQYDQGTLIADLKNLKFLQDTLAEFDQDARKLIPTIITSSMLRRIATQNGAELQPSPLLRMGAKPSAAVFAQDNLKQISRELSAWQTSGMLSEGSKLGELGAILQAQFPVDFMQVAEQIATRCIIKAYANS
ncbi:hypothetical protein HNP46_000291 [Pseudomonas nitritireducens]|uniref:Uncharacterized protein n=1 Tax=Pseudomonas nitroreducens TaxID=46680 RepID=A0A7W7KFC7_PSENT|nr:hypothetical protein [Pseudomonas nitritireducens]MBB4861480.1 hypothetical protein [Pseudomonas nitritireducens]